MKKTRILRRLATRASCREPSLAHVLRELEHAEDPQESQEPHDEQRLAARKEEAEVGGQDRRQVHEPEEAQHVAQGPAHRHDPQDVLEREGALSAHSSARRMVPYLSRTPSMLSSMTAATLTRMKKISARSKALPAGVLAWYPYPRTSSGYSMDPPALGGRRWGDLVDSTSMNRLLVILMALMALASPAIGLAIPAEDQCREADECGDAPSCDDACSLCACCIGARTPVLAAFTMAGAPDDAPCSPGGVAVVQPLAPPPADILHVPKSR